MLNGIMISGLCALCSAPTATAVITPQIRMEKNTISEMLPLIVWFISYFFLSGIAGSGGLSGLFSEECKAHVKVESQLALYAFLIVENRISQVKFDRSIHTGKHDP